jgi:hypothetical protein
VRRSEAKTWFAKYETLSRLLTVILVLLSPAIITTKLWAEDWHAIKDEYKEAIKFILRGFDDEH